MAEKNPYREFQDYVDSVHQRALKELLKLKSFRFYMAELLGFCKTFENAFDEKGNVAAFRNGRQSVGQKIFNDIMLIDPESYLQMCKEENEHLAVGNQIMQEKKKKEEQENG